MDIFKLLDNKGKNIKNNNAQKRTGKSLLII